MGYHWASAASCAKSVRPVARMQAQGVPVAQQNALVRADLQARYRKFGLEALLPDHPMDLRHDQLFPGRARMLAGLDQIDRHHAEVVALEAGQALLSDGSSVAVWLSRAVVRLPAALAVFVTGS